MASDDIVEAMKQAALSAAQAHAQAASSVEAKEAYARGVRAMAGLVHACANVAMDYADKYSGHPVAGVMFAGYETALRHIVKAADDLIPKGYE